MRALHRLAFVFTALVALTAAALAEPDAPPADLSEVPYELPAAPSAPAVPSSSAYMEVTDSPAAIEDEGPKEPQRGDFDAGGQVRLPSGPDAMGEYATFNWIALDAQGRYYLLDSVVLHGTMPLAVKKPGELAGGVDPKLIGGLSVTLEAALPQGPFAPKKYETELALVLTGAYMREGAMLLSDKDFPLFVGSFKPGFTAGTFMKVKLSSLVDFETTPIYVQQSGSDGSLMAVQIPTSLVLGLGELVKVHADLGVFTGDNFSFRPSKGGRLAAGGAITAKIGPILAHVGAGTASLLTGGIYPTVRDAFYVDLNVKYAK